MTTKIKLNQHQYIALYELMKHTFQPNAEVVRATMQQMLYRSILESLFVKLHAKEYARQEVYQFTLKEHEAIAFYLFFQSQSFPGMYEANLITSLMFLIHKQYSQHLLS